MRVGSKLGIAVLAAALGGLIVPALAQNGMQSAPDHGMSMGQMGQGMMRGGVMSGGMMAGCSGMMQSMNNGDDGRPNSQWQQRSSPNPDQGD
jgi:hypothetical protein